MRIQTKRKNHLKNRNGLLFCVCLSAFMESVDCFIVCTSLPAIAESFNLSPAAGSRLLTYYFTSLASSLLLFGQISRKFGPRPVFIWGIAGFTVSTALCGSASGMVWLLLARVCQGVSAGAFISISAALLAHYLDPKVLGRSFGLRAAAQSLGIFLATPLGGFISHGIGWRWVFYVNVPLGLLAFCLTLLLIPGQKAISKRTFPGINLKSSISSAFLILFFILIVDSGISLGWSSIPFAVIGCLFCLSAVIFLQSETKSPNPLLNSHLRGKKSFFFSLFASTCVMMVLAGNMFLLPFYLTKGIHMSLLNAGRFLLIYPAASVVFSWLTGKLSDRLGPERLLKGSTMLLFSAFAFFSLTLSSTRLSAVAFFIIVFSWGIDGFLPSANHFVMSIASETQRSDASSLTQLAMRLGMALGVVLFHVILSSGDILTPLLSGFGLVSDFSTTETFIISMESCYIVGALVACCAACFILLSLFFRGREEERRA